MSCFLLWVSAITQLFLLVIYFSLNLSTEPGVMGILCLLLSVFFCIITLVFLSEKAVLLKLTYSMSSLVVFILYFLMNFLWDSQSISDFKEVTIGTSGGVIFAIIAGCTSSLSLGSLSKCFSKDFFYIQLTKVSFLVIMIVSLLLAVNVFLSTIGNIRSDIFLIEDQMGLYQRPGKIMLMLYILLATLFAFMQQYIRKDFFWNVSALCLLIILAVILIAHSQLIGSNSGSVTVAIIMFAVWSYWFIIGTRKFVILKKPLQLRKIIFSWITRKLILYFSLLLFLFFISLFLFIDFDISQLRIFGFGSGANSSVDSRIDILKENFLVQLSYNPIFGNTIVDDLTTGSGTYTHSLISLLTHLGIVGTGLFLIMIFLIYHDIYTPQSKCDNYYHTNSYALFRLFILTSVIIFTLFTAFFTWMPLWFSIGLLGVSFNLKGSY
ncbi:hypothetical protein [Pseudoalteromonas sp. SWXJZ10B]|uniref:hypothetical protein n=1 Tax=Pseudoalteromonas sp. SWXJZ10B TaxID=2792063 RepID=UPI0018CD6163|nr:hypothetical protein [Pseudoalteromonas sp. SWXJZ10B]MBH0042057.1 hypothetical protein [Pseudoalteromonas sp. SWXJZ10B]